MKINKVLPPDLEVLYKEVDAYEYKPLQDQPPCIGLSANLKEGLSCIANTYVNAILEAGGIPVLIPVTTEIEVLSSLLENIDALILTGGGDINPLFCKEQPIPQLGEGNTFRDQYDLTLLRLASQRQIPILGICRGHQLINLAYGGTLYQDIYVQREEKTIQHTQCLPREEASHLIEIKQGSLLSDLLGSEIAVNSFHHQAIKEVARGFEVTAFSPDGIIEAIESVIPYRQIICVQWHPEAMAAAGDQTMLKLFVHLVSQAQSFKQIKALHNRLITLDSHCDTPMLFNEGVSLGKKNELGKVNIPNMIEGKLDAACIVAYLKQEARDEHSLQKATDKATRIIQEIKRQVEEYNEIAEIAYTPEDILRIKNAGKKAFLLGIENGYALGKDLANLACFKEMGIVYLTLCHNGDNDLCDSAKGNSEWNGLSPFGTLAVREMNRLGIMIDVSHASEKTFYDVIKESRYPIIASHSSSRTICNHPRNLTDEQLIALAENGGVVQVCLYGGFLNEKENEASVLDVVRHVCHIAELIGTDHIGIGSDFDGGGGITGCNSSNELINITKALLDAGFSESDLQKIWGGNFLRVMHIVQSGNK
ncbi:gamma-glutamyl-gamma-aminobutyrate hydrolase family protein [Parabacteroides pacaensis]|uniref:gamma-glutamyl-gamma-aminobutyrate hydrolase family protein n=1 Tax=Parabacteroides pacaensis TaxID=2086575 RepID=UPI000D10FEC6|nr:gamma-glutamyl-gamma-aminobutyrate hydrolase family protein [Parabacteroides pacaensis]